MAKTITLLICLINLFICQAQFANYTSIDTSNVDYRNNLKVIYAERAAKTLLLLKDYPAKNVKKVLTQSYNRVNNEFINKINNGFFIKDSFYEDRINTLFKKIVDANPQYKALASTKILLSFSDTPNAYAMGDGFVVVNLPLLGNLKNEYELAFIICHELAHNLLNHPSDGLLEYAKTQTSHEIKKQTHEIDKNKYNKAENASHFYKKIVYDNRKKHRGVEFQADSLGYILYSNAFAGKEAIALKSFSTLDDMDIEKDSLELNDYEKLFSSDKQPFKEKWISDDEISMYNYDKTLKFWQIDSLKTHPDCIDRANRLKTIFLIDTENDEVHTTYDDVAARAKYDHITGLYFLKEYGKSLYEALLLLKDNDNNTYLKSLVYSNLVKIQEAQKNYTMNKYVETVNPRYSNSYNKFLSFLRQLRKSEMTELINQYSINT